MKDTQARNDLIKIDREVRKLSHDIFDIRFDAITHQHSIKLNGARIEITDLLKMLLEHLNLEVVDEGVQLRERQP